MEHARRGFRAMGSPCELRLYARDAAAAARALDLAEAEIARLEAKYTRYRDDSETTRINRGAGDARGVEVDAETAALLDYAAVAHAESDGLFDITSGVLRRVWRFDRGTLPDPGDVAALLPLIGWHRVSWRRPRLVLPTRGMEIDFGGVVKEYAVDTVVELCRREGVAHGLVDLGGDIGVIGPHPDGSPWRVGIRDPWNAERAAAVLAMADGGLATSGDYERCIEIDGRRYGHILDPRDGWPVRSLVSVSVRAPRCIVAGTAATTALLRGREGGPPWLAGLGLPHLTIDRDGTIGGTLE
ncbi:ApbE family lipoprotein [Salinisphaera sp. PC39]|uniref:FAD:protein FMN transferase n=1 Tax=Salinisphaera sp. PC39 TaxID=1304156 RepID=UPI00333E652C